MSTEPTPEEQKDADRLHAFINRRILIYGKPPSLPEMLEFLATAVSLSDRKPNDHRRLAILLRLLEAQGRLKLGGAKEQ